MHTSVYLKQTDNRSVCELKICTSLAYLWCANANCTHKSIAARKCLGSAEIHREVYKQPKNLTMFASCSTNLFSQIPGELNYDCNLTPSVRELHRRNPLVKLSVVTTLLFAHNS